MIKEVRQDEVTGKVTVVCRRDRRHRPVDSKRGRAGPVNRWLRRTVRDIPLGGHPCEVEIEYAQVFLSRLVCVSKPCRLWRLEPVRLGASPVWSPGCAGTCRLIRDCRRAQFKEAKKLDDLTGQLRRRARGFRDTGYLKLKIYQLNTPDKPSFLYANVPASGSENRMATV